ncbi:hypothetical protein ES705_10748 [subsurface metagenome]
MGHEAIKPELIEWLTKLDDSDTIDYFKIIKDSGFSDKVWWHDLTDKTYGDAPKPESVDKSLITE